MNDNLIPLPISHLLDKQFFIPHYQRGYRWTDLQVRQLLDDIDSFSPKEIRENEKTFYCLQPVVVKELTEDTKQIYKLEGQWFEVIDGQQRLTTIFVILQYINQKWTGEDKIKQFKLNYETRTGCVEFLSGIKVNADNTVNIDKSNIDFYHISTALHTIRKWQLDYQTKNGKPLNTANFQSTFFEFSKIIWYQVLPHQKSQALFERLNLGKIPLTNAELTKALFLSSESFKSLPQDERRIKQIEIARIWDDIEHKLDEKDLKFWSFITNKKRDNYDTKIELILDLISEKNDNEKDAFYTFLKFSKKQKNESLADVWQDIEQFYYTLLEWYYSKKYYHKIGYLVAAKQFGDFKGINLGQLVKHSMNDPKDKFDERVDNLIKDSVKVELSELRYENHYNQLFNVLLLFNVETNRKSDAISEFYPFKQHKDRKWSLEHIHARNSENFDKTKKDPWLKWLSLHLPILQNLLSKENVDNNSINNAIKEIQDKNNEHLTWDRFSKIFKTVNDILTIEHESMDRDSEGLFNLALLSQPDNSALNNSVFEVKRQEIIRLDKEGNFIPICTRRAFMKYYNEEGISTQHFYWSDRDRNTYFAALKSMIEQYLPKNHIEIISDENE